jgi:hypothetical protein
MMLRAQRQRLPSPRGAVGRGRGWGACPPPSAPHPGAFGADPPHRFAEGGWSPLFARVANEAVCA